MVISRTTMEKATLAKTAKRDQRNGKQSGYTETARPAESGQAPKARRSGRVGQTNVGRHPNRSAKRLASSRQTPRSPNTPKSLRTCVARSSRHSLRAAATAGTYPNSNGGQHQADRMRQSQTPGGQSSLRLRVSCVHYTRNPSENPALFFQREQGILLPIYF
jgi:hypothetical protein